MGVAVTLCFAARRVATSFQRIGRARGENQVVAVLRKALREVDADARRRAGHQRGLSFTSAFAGHWRSSFVVEPQCSGSLGCRQVQSYLTKRQI